MTNRVLIVSLLAAGLPLASAVLADQAASPGVSPIREGRTPMLAAIVLSQVDPLPPSVCAPEEPARCYVESPTPDEALSIQRNHALPAGQVISGLRFFSPSTWVNDGSQGTVGQARQARLTFSFPADNTPWGSGASTPNQLRADLVDLFGEGNTDQGYELLRHAYAVWRRHSSLTFTQVSDNNSPLSTSNNRVAARGDMRIGAIPQGTTGTLAYNYYPSGGGDTTINSDYMNPGVSMGQTGNNYRYLRNTIAHEIGHGIGFRHPVPCNNTKLMEPFINTGFDGIQIDEIRGVQHNYGDRYAGNTTAALARDFGSLTTPALRAVRERMLSTNGAGGANGSSTDWFRFSLASAQTVRVSIHQKGGSYLNQPQVDGCTGASDPAPTVNADAAGTLELSLQSGTTAPTTIISTLTATFNAGVNRYEALIPAASLAAGNYWVRVRDIGPNASANQFVQLYDLEIRPTGALAPPLAIAGANTKRVRTGEAAWFMGNINSVAQEYTSDVNGNPIAISSYAWDLDNDGTFEVATAQTRRVYHTPGTTTVTLRVTDANGRQATDTMQVVVGGSGSITSLTGATPGIGGSATPFVINGSNLFDLTTLAQVRLTGTGVTVSGTPVVNGAGTQVTGLFLTAASSAALGTRDLILTDMDMANGDTAFISIAGVSVIAIPPANDACTSATPIAPFDAGVSTTTGTVAYATVDGATTCQSASGPGIDVYHAVTTTEDRSFRIETCGGPSSWDTILSVHSGCPATSANTVAGACIDQGCSSGNLSGVTIQNLPAGSYVIRIAGKQPTTVGNTYALKITDLGPPPPLPLNDECAGAIEIEQPYTLVQFSTVASTNSTVTNASCGPMTGDLWYRITPTSPGLLRIVGMLANGRTAVYDMGGSPSCSVIPASLACQTTGQWTEASLSVGRTYFIRTGLSGVTGRSTDQLEFSFIPANAGSCCVDGVCTIVPAAQCDGAFVLGGACLPATTDVDEATGTGGPIPDFNTVTGATPIVSNVAIPSPATVAEVEVDLNLIHAYGGDLVATLEHNGRVVPLFTRVGRSSGFPTGRTSDFTVGTYTIADAASLSLSQAVSSTPSTIPPGAYKPSGTGGQIVSLRDAFAGMPAAGDWTLKIYDFNATISGTLMSWSIRVKSAAPSPCVPLRACCLPDGACQVLSEADCAAAEGVYQPAAAACDAVSCPQPTGACCAADGSCSLALAPACPGVFHGPGTACDAVACEQPGVCCRGSICIAVGQSACLAIEPQTFTRFVQVADAACNAPGNNAIPCCRADFNQNGSTTIDDIFIYLNSWFDADVRCDITGNGASGPTIDDIFVYLGRWFEGCN